MDNTIGKLNISYRKMMFDFVYEDMSVKEVAAKHGVSDSDLCAIRRSPFWKSEERKMWEEFIALLIHRRNVNRMM